MRHRIEFDTVAETLPYVIETIVRALSRPASISIEPCGPAGGNPNVVVITLEPDAVKAIVRDAYGDPNMSDDDMFIHRLVVEVKDTIEVLDHGDLALGTTGEWTRYTVDFVLPDGSLVLTYDESAENIGPGCRFVLDYADGQYWADERIVGVRPWTERPERVNDAATATGMYDHDDIS